MVLPPFTFMVDPAMNLMSEPHHECERRETILRVPGVLKNYSHVTSVSYEMSLTFSQFIMSFNFFNVFRFLNNKETENKTNKNIILKKKIVFKRLKDLKCGTSLLKEKTGTT